jgi:hypothetical protein
LKVPTFARKVETFKGEAGISGPRPGISGLKRGIFRGHTGISGPKVVTFDLEISTFAPKIRTAAA